jgi:antitoxin CcdA
MANAMDAASTKRHTNLTLSADVLSEAKKLGINISKVCDGFLRELIRQEKERRWKAEHTEFVSAFNAEIESVGLPLNQWRTF